MEGEAARVDERRPLTTGDLLRLEQLGDVALSPDGSWLAFVVKRSRSSAKFHKYDFLDGGDRGDIWLVEISGGPPQNLTEGASDGSGYWAPIWSPDSGRLAMLSTKGGNVHVWGCELDSRSLARLCDRAVDLGSNSAPHLWLSDRKLLVATLPEGARPLRMTVELQAAEVAMQEWPKAWRGEHPTNSALDSGSHAPFEERPQGELRLVDVASGLQQTVLSGFFRDIRASPDKRHVAFLRQVDVVRPEANRKLERIGHELYRLGIVGAAGDVVADAVEGVGQPLSGSLRWSPDSAELALIGRDEEPGAASARIFRYRLSDRTVQPVTDARIQPRSFLWRDAREMLALATRAQGSREERAGRADWWLLGPDREPRNLSADLGAVPNQLFRERGQGTLVGLADGNVLRLSVEGPRWEDLTAGFSPRIAWLVWPASNVSDDQSVGQLVVAVDHGASTGWHLLDLRSGELSALAWPTDKGWLLAFAPQHSTAVQVAVDRMGTRLWVSRPAFENPRPVLETNAWLSEVAQAEVRRVDYRGLEGDELKGWLMLPVDYEPGKRYPLVTWVYPGAVYGSETPPTRSLSIGAHHVLDYQLLPARGYAVLLPSMPLKPEDEASDPYAELPKGVLPAVDRAIELGVADPDRLALMGQSNGGYGTYGLITQTRRFKAAVALAGFADHVGLYGQLDPRRRYDPHAHEDFFRMALAESGQHRMGAPPWRDAQRYLRNSPIYYADRAETPLLIIQGDMDYVPLQQGEQFFSALYRQGKRARFVRYWGEGHVFQSPANIVNMWEEIYDWLEEFLKPSAGAPHR